ncbi:MAG: helix-turn-helix transcriptional regulator [Firmicutes bacterium]|nr:helix-turn-helix transcriptional regulator [Bacillota bacterium]
MIRIKVSNLMGKYKMKNSDLAELSGIRPNTISELFYERIKRFDVEILNRLCKAFKCQVGDILEYIPDEEYKPMEQPEWVKKRARKAKASDY